MGGAITGLWNQLSICKIYEIALASNIHVIIEDCGDTISNRQTRYSTAVTAHPSFITVS